MVFWMFLERRLERVYRHYLKKFFEKIALLISLERRLKRGLGGAKCALG